MRSDINGKQEVKYKANCTGFLTAMLDCCYEGDCLMVLVLELKRSFDGWGILHVTQSSENEGEEKFLSAGLET